MTKKISFFCLLGMVLISGCLSRPGYEGEVTSPAHRPDQRWTVEVKFWPGRLDEPEAREDTATVVQWDYRSVRRNERERVQLYMTDSQDTYLLAGDNPGELEEIYRLVEEKNDTYKLEHIHSSLLAEGPLFYLASGRAEPVIWYHPYRGQTEANRRFNFHRYSPRPSDWIYQEVEEREDSYIFRLIYEPEDVEVEFRWPEEGPWWSKAVWRQQGRVVAVAETDFDL